MKILTNIFTFISKKEIYGLAGIIFLGILTYKLGNKLIENIINNGKSKYERKKRKTIVNLLSKVIKVIVFILVIFFILDLYGVNTRALIASFGVASALIGLAFQDTAKDLISGITIIMDNYFVMGDVITINDFTGEVVEMGLRSTKIKKFSGEILIISNRNINQVINLSQKKANLVINIPTSYEYKTSKVEKTISKILEEAKKIKGVSEDSKYLGISEFSDSSIDYSISIVCNQDDKWQIKRDILKIIKDTYDKDKITIPYPQVEVHNEKL